MMRLVRCALTFSSPSPRWLQRRPSFIIFKQIWLKPTPPGLIQLLLNLLLSQLFRFSVSTGGGGLPVPGGVLLASVEPPSLIGTSGALSLENAWGGGVGAPLPW